VTGDTPAPPLGIDTTVATAARMYDHWLGGHDNFAADRIAAGAVTAAAPEAPALARANRRFLRRAVTCLAATGISQFFDLGTGLPTRGNVHEIAQRASPGARVVYVDNDPMVAAHARALKTGPGVAVLHADLRDPGAILADPVTRRLLDLSQPLAILFAAVLHFVSDADSPHAAVSRYLEAAAPGSHLVISHITSDPGPQTAAEVSAVYAATANPATPRTRAQILAFFDGIDLIEPGLVPVQRWRPAKPPRPGPGQEWLLGGIARKPD
jgi:SAM-dependent methyltransferase